MSSADLVKELTSNASLLLQRQVKLATLEAKKELKRAKIMVGLFGVAGLFAYAAAILGLASGALRIGAALEGRHWAGALIVAGALFVPAIVIGLIGYRKRLKKALASTRAELSKEITWARHRTT